MLETAKKTNKESQLRAAQNELEVVSLCDLYLKSQLQ